MIFAQFNSRDNEFFATEGSLSYLGNTWADNREKVGQDDYLPHLFYLEYFIIFMSESVENFHKYVILYF